MVGGDVVCAYIGRPLPQGVDADAFVTVPRGVCEICVIMCTGVCNIYPKFAALSARGY